jgi:Flp pilus assembly protein TadG
MHGKLSRKRREDGAVAIVVAISLTALLVGVAMVLDFGLVRVDRQVDKSAADAAVSAGLHGLNTGDSKPHPFVGVCAAIRYLQRNDDRFAGISDTAGAWTDGNGAAKGNGCDLANTALRSQPCDTSAVQPSSWARFTWTPSDGRIGVVIQSGYLVTGATGWSEDALTAAQNDPGSDAFKGCDQLSVVVTQSRKPGLGSLATSSDLTTSIRSVGRIQPGQGGYAPAMLLLKQTGCPVLQVGSTGGGANSFVHVYGAVSAVNGLSQPGTIHADTDGSSCSGSGGNWVFYGKATSGIVTYAAPTVGSPGVPDAAKPGSITSYATNKGVGIGVVRDDPANVYASSALDPAGAGSATKGEPTGRDRVTRLPVDQRYIAGVRNIITAANSEITAIPATAAAATASGQYQVATCANNGVVAALPTPVDASKSLYVDCTSLVGMPTWAPGTGWAKVVFNGDVSPSSALSLPVTSADIKGNLVPAASFQLPYAKHVYVRGTGGNSISLGSHNEFHMNTNGVLDASSNCTTGQNTSTAVLVIKNGGLNQNGGLLQLCRTTVVMMGGRDDGCVPAYNQVTATVGPPPMTNPCNGGAGTAQIKQTGGDVDWTAPDRWDAMTLADGNPDPTRSPDWTNVDGPEDLALWTESSSNNSSNKASLGGGSVMRVRGVFMVPNFDSMIVGGGGYLNLRNAQFIASSIALNGGTQIDMLVDPNSAVTLPKLTVVGLVR